MDWECVATSLDRWNSRNTPIDKDPTSPSSVCRIEITQFGECYICKLCNVSCTSKIAFTQHEMGANHTRRVVLNALFCQEWNENSNTTEQNASYCSETFYESQTSGQIRIEQQSTGNTDETYFCEPCGLSCNSKKQLDCHLQGKKHFKQLRQSILN
uniref:C2H2-type domain-containing protein n=1 Tax=Trichobilharzia regenti TaxID=157069 RepID=A0AA85JMP5_TRIRE|nr:unnamed protein product [Trichobilharzia regenti]